MVYRMVKFVPGLYKIFDEILVNAADNKVRDPSMNTLKVSVDRVNNTVSVYNNGRGIPVEMHATEHVRRPGSGPALQRPAPCSPAVRARGPWTALLNVDAGRSGCPSSSLVTCSPAPTTTTKRKRSWVAATAMVRNCATSSAPSSLWKLVRRQAVRALPYGSPLTALGGPRA